MVVSLHVIISSSTPPSAEAQIPSVMLPEPLGTTFIDRSEPCNLPRFFLIVCGPQSIFWDFPLLELKFPNMLSCRRPFLLLLVVNPTRYGPIYYRLTILIFTKPKQRKVRFQTSPSPNWLFSLRCPLSPVGLSPVRHIA